MIILVCVAMVFCGLSIAAPEVGVSAQTTNASESTSKVYSNDYYTLSYENNEIKVLLNTDVTVYKNLSKEDLVELKNAIIIDFWETHFSPEYCLSIFVSYIKV